MFNFGKKKGKGRRSHLKNLYAVAMADGSIAEIEDHLMFSVAHRLGISEKEFQEIKDNLDDVKFMLPEHYDDRIEQFQDLLMLVSADGHIDNSEIETCRKMAGWYQLSDSEFNRLITQYLK